MIPASVNLDFTGSGVSLVSVTCVVLTGPAACGAGIQAGTGAEVMLPGMGAASVVALTVVAIAPPAPGVITLEASAPVNPPVTDPQPGNNTAVFATTVGSPPPLVRADLAVTLLGPPEVAIGGRATYTTTVHNLGPSDAAGVALLVVPQPGFVFQSALGACTAAPPCQLGTLAPGATRLALLTYALSPTTPATGR